MESSLGVLLPYVIHRARTGSTILNSSDPTVCSSRSASMRVVLPHVIGHASKLRLLIIKRSFYEHGQAFGVLIGVFCGVLTCTHWYRVLKIDHMSGLLVHECSIYFVSNWYCSYRSHHLCCFISFFRIILVLIAYKRITNFWGAFAKLRKRTISFVMSVLLPVRPSVHTELLGPTAQILMKFYIWFFVKNLSRKFRFLWNKYSNTHSEYVILIAFPL